jgi:hypothetical protein
VLVCLLAVDNDTGDRRRQRGSHTGGTQGLFRNKASWLPPARRGRRGGGKCPQGSRAFFAFKRRMRWCPAAGSWGMRSHCMKRPFGESLFVSEEASSLHTHPANTPVYRGSCAAPCHAAAGWDAQGLGAFVPGPASASLGKKPPHHPSLPSHSSKKTPLHRQSTLLLPSPFGPCHTGLVKYFARSSTQRSDFLHPRPRVCRALIPPC